MKVIKHINSGETYLANEVHYIKHNGIYGYLALLSDGNGVGFFYGCGDESEWEDVSSEFTVSSDIPTGNILTNLDTLDMLRPATSRDIAVGNVVYIIGDHNYLHKKVISEVIDVGSMFKAFCAEDGCRYGLDGLYIQKGNAELSARVDELEKHISKLKTAINKIYPS